ESREKKESEKKVESGEKKESEKKKEMNSEGVPLFRSGLEHVFQEKSPVYTLRSRRHSLESSYFTFLNKPVHQTLIPDLAPRPPSKLDSPLVILKPSSEIEE
ncbi:hypothetical protein U1Q18_030144, partial [Sarracenia purpurea var. burkii]